VSSTVTRAATPEIRRSPLPDEEAGPVPGTGLCLSGGGFRAMLFHVGSLIRLNEAGFLPKLDRISSVSGGSIAAGVLAVNWSRMSVDGAGMATNLEDAFVAPLRAFARKTVDLPAVLVGLLTPRTTINDQLARRYRDLFGKHTLADLPDHPEFIFDATSLQSGDLWRFSSKSEGDWRVGVQRTPTTDLASVVAASSAFPPVLSPARLRFPADALTDGSDSDINHAPYTTRVVLSDGGVYDNLGLEAVWKRYQQVLISDAGGHMRDAPRPLAFWPVQVFRVLSVIDNQVRDLRKSQAVQSFIDERRTGTYWGIRSHVRDFHLAHPIVDPSDETVRELAEIPTRLARVDDYRQERLINWGYAICDTAMRAHVSPDLAEGRLPYPETGVAGSAKAVT
jgi:NTE family protein